MNGRMTLVLLIGGECDGIRWGVMRLCGFIVYSVYKVMIACVGERQVHCINMVFSAFIG